jgi:dihydrofolate reductase
MIDVISLNGRITRGEGTDIQAWASKEDAELFAKLREGYTAHVMGQGTYEARKPAAKDGTLRIVLTRTPEKFKDKQVPDQLEFMDVSPTEVVELLKQRRHEQVFLAGGSRLNAAFMQAGLVDDLYITIEPQLFGTGLNLLAETPDYFANLQLQSLTRLNDRGTLHAHYTVQK